MVGENETKRFSGLFRRNGGRGRALLLACGAVLVVYLPYMLFGRSGALLFVCLLTALIGIRPLIAGRGPGGRARASKGFGSDVAARLLLERADGENAPPYYLLFERSPLPMWVYDAESLRFLAVNDAAVAHYGYTRAEFLAMTIVDMRPAEDCASLADGIRQSVDWRHRRRDGSIIRVEINSNELSFGGRRVKLVLANDITARRERETELARARDAALESSRLKSQFLANMSHEIRTPMNGVIGMTDLLLDTELGAEQRDYTQTIQRSADSLLVVINDILDFSKIEAGKLTIESLEFDLRHAVEDAVEMLAEPAQARGLELICYVDEEVPRTLMGDPGRLRQIITNLVGNAVKFTEHGEVFLSVSALPAPDRSSRLICFQVCDTGPGIAPAALPTLFEPFVQADGSPVHRHGTGLGLTISRQLAQLMGGEIGARSREGEGSTFWFTVRLGMTAGDPTQEPASPALAAGARVLVVDDNETSRQILRHQFGAWGLEHEGAPGAPEARALLNGAARAGLPFDAAVIDLQMPGMDGLELAHAVGADPLTAGTPLLMLTSLGKPRQVELRAAGVVASLAKPVRQTQLREALARLLSPARRTADTAPAAHRAEACVRGAEHTSKDSSARAARVLVVDDNVVNQQVAVNLLRRLGHTAHVAANGIEALRALDLSAYDLVLMDCQMPEMDGYAATAEIRRREAGTSRRMPVVAITANAMQGDRERCLSAGMDDYLSKPVRRRDLAAMIERWLGSATGDGPQPEHEAEPQRCELPRTPGDIETVGERLADLAASVGPELADELFNIFIADTEERLGVVERLLDTRDFEGVAHEAHTIKGSASSLGASRLASASSTLEGLSKKAHAEGAREGTEAEVRALLAGLVERFDHVKSMALCPQSPGTHADEGAGGVVALSLAGEV